MKNPIKTIKAVFRGIVKAIPVGNILVEMYQNKKALNKDVTLDEKGEIEDIEMPHNLVSIIVQAIVLIVLLYSFFTKQIDINKLIDYINSFFGL